MAVASARKPRRRKRSLRVGAPRSSSTNAGIVSYGRRGRSYDGGKLDRAFADWISDSLSPDVDLLGDFDTLRSRSRDLHRNNSFARGLVRGMTTNVVGTGFIAESTVDHEEAGITERQALNFRRRADRLWRRWAPHADANGRKDFTALLENVLTSLIVDGDVFVLLPRIQRDRFRPLWLACEIIEGHRVSNPDGHVTEAKGRRIREGVELDQFGRAVAIWVEIVDQSEQQLGEALPKKNWRRIAIRDRAGRARVLHIALQQRYGQTRGEPIFAPCLGSFRHLDSWLESELLAKRTESCFAAFITRQEILDEEGNPLGDEFDDEGDPITRLEPAMLARLAPGEQVQFGNPTRPGQGFDDFVKRILRGIAVALGLPYEVAFSEYAGMNYSNARTAILDARRVFQTWQRMLAVQFATPVWQLVLEEGILREKLPLIGRVESALPELTAVHWTFSGWDWVDPQKEVTAQKLAVEAGFTSKKAVCAARGLDFEEVARQRKREMELEEELGLPAAPATSSSMGAAPEDRDEDADEEEKAA